MKENVDRVYFRNLHGFRFLAAFLVIVCHIELFKGRLGIPNAWKFPLIFEGGSAGVDFFFVLSGFLITALLLKENELTGEINITHFYLRRVLRIWPLYYLVLLLCYFIVPHISIMEISGYSGDLKADFWSKVGLSILFLPNVALAIFREIPYAAPLWSVGVEEQFYLFWPVLLFAFRNTFKTIVAFVLAFIALKVVFVISHHFLHFDLKKYTIIKDILVSSRMELMGLGGLGAYVFRNHPELLKRLNSSHALVACLLTLPLVLFNTGIFMELHHVVLAILFLVIILNGATNKNSLINLEGKMFSFLGNISFGLYLWHSLVIGVVINLLVKIIPVKHLPILFNILLYAGTIGGTVLISWLSYQYYEKIFLQKKNNYSVVLSGTEAKVAEQPA